MYGRVFLVLHGMVQKGSMKLCEYINQVTLRQMLLLVWVKLISLASPGISAHHNHLTTIMCTQIGGGGVVVAVVVVIVVFSLSHLVSAAYSHHQEAVFQTSC